MRQNNIALGKAGELRVAAELLLRGHEVFLPATDSGTDLTLGNGGRIQVKVSKRGATQAKDKHSNYCFNFKSWRKQGNYFAPHKLEGIDYVILWAVEDNAFLIIPAEEIRGQLSIRVYLNNKAKSDKFSRFRDRWDLLQG